MSKKKKEFDSPYIPQKPFSDDEILEGYQKMVEKNPYGYSIEEVAASYYGDLGLCTHFGPGVKYEDEEQYLYNEYIARNLKGLHYSQDSKILRNHGWVVVGVSIFHYWEVVAVSSKADPELCDKLMNDKELAKAEARKFDEEHRQLDWIGFKFDMVTPEMTAAEVYEIQKNEEKRAYKNHSWYWADYLRRAESRYFFKELAKRDGGIDIIMKDIPDFVTSWDARKEADCVEFLDWKKILEDRAYWLSELGFNAEANKFYGYAKDLEWAWDTRFRRR